MDWSRAKNVLIFTFLLLNLVLGFQLWSDMRETAGPSLDFTSLDKDTQRLMEEKGIQVLAPIPGGTPELPKLSYTYVEGEKGKKVKLANPVDSKLIFSLPELTEALRSEIPDIANYDYDPLAEYDSEDAFGAFVLHPLVEGRWPLFKVNLELYYSNQKIMEYRKIPVELTTTEEKETALPAAKALGRLVDNYLPMEAVVKDIRLGYYGRDFNSDNQVAVAVWRFILEDGQEYYVQMNGDVISPKTEQTEEL
jgi:regulatory protein YycI of two-component signal transduction system YycFG